MLVLTRKLKEQIRVGDNIVITILRVKGNQVRVGIEAPREVRVVRGEISPRPVEVECESASARLPQVPDAPATPSRVSASRLPRAATETAADIRGPLVPWIQSPTTV